MAAHVKTGLEQTIAELTHPSPGPCRADNFRLMFRSALDLSCWTEDLELEHWQQFSEAVDIGNFALMLKIATGLLPVYTQQWQDLGEPRNREDWHKAKYSEV